MDWWQKVSAFGESALESIGEGVSKYADAFTEFKVTELADKYASPDVMRQVEPQKGTTVEGQPIVVTQPGTVSTQTVWLIGGALAAALAVVMLKN